MTFRRWNNLLHRDLGYLAFGLTAVYAVSGVALNHMADWNPNYRKVTEVREIGPMPRQWEEEDLAREALKRLQETLPMKGSYQPDPDTLQVFVEGGSYSVDLPLGKVVFESVRPRPVLYAANRLHVNAPKRAWTWIADAYGLVLLCVALTGLFVVKGKKGITGRGAWLTAVGCAVPAAYWFWWVGR